MLLILFNGKHVSGFVFRKLNSASKIEFTMGKSHTFRFSHVAQTHRGKFIFSLFRDDKEEGGGFCFVYIARKVQRNLFFFR